jgi:molybdopterin converting factor small subunit
MLNNDVSEASIKIAIMPGFSELVILINPRGEVTRKGLASIVMPWLYAPWLDAKEKGIIQIRVDGVTLRALLTELSQQYQQANVDFAPINDRTGDLDPDYDVLVNGQNYVTLPHSLDTELRDGDEVKVKMLWRWDG